MTAEPEASAPTEWFDSHCHLDADYGGKSAADLVREAGLANVTRLVCVGVELDSIDRVRAISEAHANVVHTAGVHPHEASRLVEAGSAGLERLREASRHPKCRAIGEIGLDYYYNHSPRDAQLAALRSQLALALEVALPVVIHSRDAEADLLPALSAYAQAVPEGRVPGVIHCFTGTAGFGRACLDLGFYISFSGILTFKKADDLRACTRDFPLNRLLVETDSPYLAPIPFRGRKCEPAMTPHTGAKIAEIRGVSPEVVARATTENARRVFGV